MRRAVLLAVLFLLSLVITPVRAESFDGSELRVSGGVFPLAFGIVNDELPGETFLFKVALRHQGRNRLAEDGLVAGDRRPDAPELLDPQRVQDQEEMTWSDYRPIPGANVEPAVLSEEDASRIHMPCRRSILTSQRARRTTWKRLSANKALRGCCCHPVLRDACV